MAFDYKIGQNLEVAGSIKSRATRDIILLPSAGQNVDVSDVKITTLADPTNPQDAVNLRTLQTQIAGGSDFVGGFDASAGTYPTAGSGPVGEIIAGDRRYITVGGTLNNGTGTSIIVEAGDELVALIDNAVNNDDFYGLERNRTFTGGDGITLSGSDVLAVDLTPTISGLEFNAGQLQIKGLADYTTPVGTNLAIGQDGAGNLVIDSNQIDAASAVGLQEVLDNGNSATNATMSVVTGSGTSGDGSVRLDVLSNSMTLRTETNVVNSFGQIDMSNGQLFFSISNGLDNKITKYGDAYFEYFTPNVADFVGNTLVHKDYVDTEITNATATSATVFRDSFVDADLTAGIYTVTHNLGNAYVTVTVYDDTNAIVGGVATNPTTNTIDLDLSLVGPITGTRNVVVTG